MIPKVIGLVLVILIGSKPSAGPEILAVGVPGGAAVWLIARHHERKLWRLMQARDQALRRLKR